MGNTVQNNNAPENALKPRKSISPAFRSKLITCGMVVALFIIVEILDSTGNMSNLFSGLLVPICYYVTIALSLNLVVGILGELSLGHGGFMCVGAYASAFFTVATQNIITDVWIRFPLAFLVGGLTAAVFGILIGIPVLRLKGDYLAIVTLAFGEIIKNVVTALYVGIDGSGIHFSTTSADALNLAEDGKVIIKGALGITGIPKSSNVIVGFVIVMITLIVCLNLIDSRTGRAIMSIRDNRIAAESIGINVTKHKLFVFAISAFFAGLAGTLYSHNLSGLTANTNNFGYNMSITILVMVVLGGIGSMRGSVIAAIILTALPEMLRGFSEYRMLIYAVVLIVMMIINNNPTIKAKLSMIAPKVLIAKFRNRKKNNVQKGAEE